MTRRILILQGHPDGNRPHLCHALAAAYADGARAAGHEVRTVDVAKLSFPLLRSAEEFNRGEPPESLVPAWEDMLWAEHLVIVFPLWLGTMPALLKGFLEQVARPGKAFSYDQRGIPHKLLRGRSARVVVTMGMPAIVYRLWFLAHGVRGLERSILQFVGIRPCRETLFGMVEAVSPRRRDAWLAKMRRLGGRAI
jgi:putative NADPH-quinone reductase